MRSVMGAVGRRRQRTIGTLEGPPRRRHVDRLGHDDRWDSGVPARHRVAHRGSQGIRSGRRSAGVDVGHAVPARVPQGRAGDQCRQSQSTARRAGQPVRLRRFAGVDAPPPTGVRRGDRPGRHQLRGPDRLRRGVALPRRSVRGVLQGAERVDGDRCGRRLVRIGDRWCTGRSDRVCREVKKRTESRSSRSRRSRGDRRHRWAPRPPACATHSRRSPTRCAPRCSVRWPTSSTRFTRSTEPCGSARSIGSSQPSELRPYIVDALERGMERST